MLISHEHEFIFIHIGKTGGTSIEKVLCTQLGIDFERTKKDPDGNWWKHIWAKGMRKQVGKNTWDNYFKFAFVRNPYDMIVSLYSMYTQYPEYTNRELYPALYHPWNQYDSFNEMVLGMGHDIHEPDDQWRRQLDKLNAQTHTDVWNGLANLYTSYLTESWKGENGYGEILVDFVGRFENLDEDFAFACEQIGLPSYELIHHGATEHRPYSELYSDEAREIVSKHFEIDIDRFNYKF